MLPGALIHGAGSWTAGRRSTGYRLLAAEGVGLGMIVLGGGTLALTGANRVLVGPAAAVTIAGVGLFTVSWLADIYGTSTGPEGTGSPRTTVPVLETSFGYRYVYDPQFRYRNFVHEELVWRWRGLRISPEGWFAIDDENVRVRVEAAYRFYGPTPSKRARDGTFIEVETAGTHHNYASDGFRTLTFELGFNSRLDLKRFDRSLNGSFAELGFGYGRQRFHFDAPGTSLSDPSDLLLAHFGFGFYLGTPGGMDGEAKVYYDHRHDEIAGGLLARGLANGAVGHFGVAGELFFDEHWGARVSFEGGSAYVTALNLVFRQGGTQ